MYKGEGREGMGADGMYHDYSGGYLPELAHEFRVLEAQEGLQTEPVVVFSRAEEVPVQPRQTVKPNQ